MPKRTKKKLKGGSRIKNITRINCQLDNIESYCNDSNKLPLQSINNIHRIDEEKWKYKNQTINNWDSDQYPRFKESKIGSKKNFIFLNRGGFGENYIYTLLVDEKKEIKFIRKVARKSRFPILAETLIIDKLPKECTNVIPIQELNDKSVIMPMADGDLRKRNILSSKCIKSILKIIAETLYCLWKNGLYYLDIKLENILYKCVDNKLQIFLGDLGSIFEGPNNKLFPRTLFSQNIHDKVRLFNINDFANKLFDSDYRFPLDNLENTKIYTKLIINLGRELCSRNNQDPNDIVFNGCLLKFPFLKYNLKDYIDKLLIDKVPTERERLNIIERLQKIEKSRKSYRQKKGRNNRAIARNQRRNNYNTLESNLVAEDPSLLETGINWMKSFFQ